MTTSRSMAVGMLVWANLACAGVCAENLTSDLSEITTLLTPRPQQVIAGEGHFSLRDQAWAVSLPDGPEHEFCRSVLTTGLQQAGVKIQEARNDGHTFVIGRPVELPALPNQGQANEAYVLCISPTGVMARGASPAGVLYASQTLRQLLRITAETGRLPCLTIVDYPTFRMRGVYIEGGQERFGRIVAKDYLLEQIRRLAEFKMNTLVIECYNLFPFASFPACADEGTLTETDCREILAESKRCHVTIIPSLQTLAQASELVWNCPEGSPFRETTAPGLMCPSNPALYPFITGLYRDLLQRFEDAPIIGIGCSEIDMQWQGRYCPACRPRIDAGETVRELLLGHAEKCIAAVQNVSAELGRPVRPLMWADEFYMYGPGKDWVGIERIPHETVMGYWKYWSDYSGIAGLLERGYDVLGISAMYNHSFYLADLSPDKPPKTWPPMEQTGVRNIAAMLCQAATPRQDPASSQFWGAATASFSKHRLRAFDSIWYGFALNGHATWSHPQLALDDYQAAFTKAFARHFYDARTDAAANALADTYQRLDRCKSALELANQTLGDVVGVVDTQEPGYIGNTLMGAFRRCATLMAASDKERTHLTEIREAARQVLQESSDALTLLDAQKPQVGRDRELADLELAAEKIAAHAERQILLIDTQEALMRAAGQPPELRGQSLAGLPQRWTAHRERIERLLLSVNGLAARGDPLGLAALLRDLAQIESHVTRVATANILPSTDGQREVLLEERFAALDPAKWIVLGEPRVVEGHLDTKAAGGWGNYSGIATRQAFELNDQRPLVLEFELTPLKMGVDSQLVASATQTGALSYRFSFYGPGTQFGIYTQNTDPLAGRWENLEPGWKPRAFGPPVEINVTYHVVAELTQRTWRVTVRPLDAQPLQPPLWDTGATPMDELAQTHLIFADVEPENSTAATRWGPLTIWRAR
ncbi:MAG: glycoside hydrolase family 20 zincin-like fold domain-containing protein [Pirellulaceae bacterium]